MKRFLTKLKIGKVKSMKSLARLPSVASLAPRICVEKKTFAIKILANNFSTHQLRATLSLRKVASQTKSGELQ